MLFHDVPAISYIYIYRYTDGRAWVAWNDDPGAVDKHEFGENIYKSKQMRHWKVYPNGNLQPSTNKNKSFFGTKNENPEEDLK